MLFLLTLIFFFFEKLHLTEPCARKLLISFLILCMLSQNLQRCSFTSTIVISFFLQNVVKLNSSSSEKFISPVASLIEAEFRESSSWIILKHSMRVSLHWKTDDITLDRKFHLVWQVWSKRRWHTVLNKSLLLLDEVNADKLATKFWWLW